MNRICKRILCILLIISLMFTMTGCAELAEGLAQLGHNTFVALTNLVIAGIGYGVEWVTRPVFEITGWCGCGITAAIFRGWNKLVDPDGKVVTWNDFEADDISFHYDHEVSLAEKEGMQTQTDSQDRFLSNGSGKKDHGTTEDFFPFPEGKEPKTNLLGTLIRCKHHLKYNERKNVLKCTCGANVFTSGDVPDWDYETFCACVPKLKSLYDKRGSEYFLKFKGLNEGFFEFMENLEKATPDEINTEKMLALAEMLDKVKMADTVYINYMGTADEIADAEEFDDKFADTLDVVSGLLHLNRMIEEKQDLNTACDEFLETVKTAVGSANSVTGGANTFLLVGLDSLKPVLDAYIKGAEDVQKRYDVQDIVLADLDIEFSGTWEHMMRSNAQWDSMITFEHILDIRKVEGLKLPSLSEAVERYPYLTPEGQAVTDRYNLFCMNYVFEETLGISYEQYVNMMSQY